MTLYKLVTGLLCAGLFFMPSLYGAGKWFGAAKAAAAAAGRPFHVNGAFKAAGLVSGAAFLASEAMKHFPAVSVDVVYVAPELLVRLAEAMGKGSGAFVSQGYAVLYKTGEGTCLLMGSGSFDSTVIASLPENVQRNILVVWITTKPKKSEPDLA